MKITVHIERLVLDGVNADPAQVRAALSAELAQRLSAMPPAMSAAASDYHGAALPAGTGAGAAALGGGIAQALHGVFAGGDARRTR
jgi:hypothetical protein